MHKNSKRSVELFVQACKAILARVGNLPDVRSRELVAQAFTWAIENYDKITVHTETKLARYGHMPNMVAFMNLLDGMERQSKAWGRSIQQIKHDRQTQFEKSLAYMHELYSNADPTPIKWPGMPPMSVEKAIGSKFVVSNRFESPGIQLVDIVMWLFGRLNNGDYLGGTSSASSITSSAGALTVISVSMACTQILTGRCARSWKRRSQKNSSRGPRR